MAFCPKCKNEVAFVSVGTSRKCPVCKFQYEIGRFPIEPVGASGPVVGIAGILLRFVLIVFAIVVVIVGVIFIGCVATFKL